MSSLPIEQFIEKNNFNQSVNLGLDHLVGMEIFKMTINGKNQSVSLFIKRVFDLVLTIPGIIILFPVMLVIAILIKIDSPGPIFFRQKRVGKDEKIFYIYKFRSMVNGKKKSKQYFVAENDENITNIGKILRKSKLDELPQLFNVLKGEMSLVGPRPMIPEIVSYYPSVIKKVVFSVPPGITGLASIAYMEESEILESASNPKQLYVQIIIPAKLRLYSKYVQVRNLWLDIKIIFLTLVYLFRMYYGIIKKVKPQRLKYIF